MTFLRYVSKSGFEAMWATKDCSACCSWLIVCENFRTCLCLFSIASFIHSIFFFYSNFENLSFKPFRNFNFLFSLYPYFIRNVSIFKEFRIILIDGNFLKYCRRLHSISEYHGVSIPFIWRKFSVFSECLLWTSLAFECIVRFFFL